MKFKSNIKLFKYIKIVSTLIQKLIYKAVKYQFYTTDSYLFFPLGHSHSRVTLFQHLNSNSLGTLTVFRAPLTLRQRDNTQNTYRFPDQKRTFVLFSCDYHCFFTSSLTSLSSFLTSKCVYHEGTFFLIHLIQHPATSGPHIHLSYRAHVGKASLWSHSTLSHNAGHTVLELRYLTLRQLFFYNKNFFSFQNKASNEANTAQGEHMENNWTKSQIVKRFSVFFSFISKLQLFCMGLTLYWKTLIQENIITFFVIFFMFSKFAYFL